MKAEDHLKLIRESQRLLDYAVENGLSGNQRTVGFHASAAAADVLELYLHKQSLIDPGFIIKHEWFLSKKKTAEKINFDFPKKHQILDLIMKIENKRNSLCYGKRQKESVLTEIIENFNKLKQQFGEAGLDEEI